MHTAELGTLDYFRDLADRLDNTPKGKGSRGKIIQNAGVFLKYSEQRVYRELKALAGWTSGNKQRTDKGDCRISDEEVRAVATMMVESRRANGKRLLPCGDALEIARANSLVKSDISASTVLRIMRQRGFHPDQIARPTPHIELRSLHPNHVWQFDVSICVLYYMDNGGLAVMDRKRFYKNKPENFRKIAKERVLRYLMTDHTTGSMFFKYYLAPGEDQETLYEFLMAAFAQRDHEQDPFHGVPFIFIWDAGSANQSHLIRNLLDRLDIRHWPHMPGNPRAKGQVEGGHNLVECKFEGRLCMMRVESIDHLNDVAHIWMRNFNGTAIHSRHGHTRYGLWQTIQPQQLRIVPDRAICDDLLTTKPERRQVKGNLVIKFKVKGYKPECYSVAHIPDIRINEYVDVCVNPYKAPSIYVLDKDDEGNDVRYACEPIDKDANGFMAGSPIIGEKYESAPDTETDKHRKAMAKDAYGADTLADVDKARKKKEPAFGGRVDPISYLADQTPAHYMNRHGTELDVPNRSRVEIKPLSHIETCRSLARVLGRAVKPEENAWIRSTYTDGVTEEELPVLVAHLSGETQAQRPGLAVVK